MNLHPRLTAYSGRAFAIDTHMITELEFKSLSSQGYNRIPLIAEAFAERDDVRHHAPVLHREPLAGAAPAREDLVGHEQNFPVVAEFPQLREEVVRRHDRAAPALDRLEDDRGSGVVDGGRQRVRVAGDERPLARLLGRADQVDVNVARAAFSPLIHEYKDYAVGIVDVDGNLWSASNAGRAVGYNGVTVWNPQGKLIGRIRLPEVCANITFGGPKRNRLFMTGSQSLYTVYVETQGAHIT